MVGAVPCACPCFCVSAHATTHRRLVNCPGIVTNYIDREGLLAGVSTHNTQPMFASDSATGSGIVATSSSVGL